MMFLGLLLLLPSLTALGATDKVNMSPSSRTRPLERYSSTLEAQGGIKEQDKIDALPGQPEGVSFQQYGGYVTVDSSSGRALFYYFVESPHDSATKPLLLYLNGGPGCSSLGTGALLELGPFRVERDGKTLTSNPYSWNNVANVIFLESPAGVGFSYSNTTLDYKLSGDKRTADDTYTFLINWLERFPNYKDRCLFIAGRGYAGHFITNIAHTILERNMVASQTVIKLKGIAIGNGDVDDECNLRGVYDYLWTHALISDEAYAAIENACKFLADVNETSQCLNAENLAFDQVGMVNGYNIYAPLCNTSVVQKESNELVGVDPCARNYIKTYLNLPEVQPALHANTTGLPYPWDVCSYLIPSWVDSPSSVVQNIKKLVEDGLPVWLYSGDLGFNFPVTGARCVVKSMDLPRIQSWRPWYSNGEVGGYVEIYKGLTFSTVRGAGNMVPSDQPERALTMITSFVQEMPLPIK